MNKKLHTSLDDSGKVEFYFVSRELASLADLVEKLECSVSIFLGDNDERTSYLILELQRLDLARQILRNLSYFCETCSQVKFDAGYELNLLESLSLKDLENRYENMRGLSKSADSSSPDSTVFFFD